MPILCWDSSLRTRDDHTALKLDISYRYQLGDCTDTTFNLRKPLPTCVDVISCSDLIFSVSAVVDNCSLSRDTLRQSLLLHHLVQYLRLNAGVLSINNVSDPYVDEGDGNIKINLTPGRSHVANIPRYSVMLASVHLAYAVRFIKPAKAKSGKQAVVKLKDSLLNVLMERFVTQQLVKFYPLIFGPIGERLGKEYLYFRSIAQSLLAMMKRTPNSEFQQRLRRCINGLRKRLRSADYITMKALRDCCDPSDGSDFSSTLIEANEAPKSDELTIVHGMQRLFKLSVRRPRVKGKPVTFEQSDFGFPPASVSPRCPTNLQDTGDTPMNLMFSDEDEEDTDILDKLQQSLEWCPLSGTPLSPSDQERPYFSDTEYTPSWTRLDQATSTSTNLDCKPPLLSDSDVLSSSAYLPRVCDLAPFAVRPDLDPHTHSEDDSDEDSILNFSSKDEHWHQDFYCSSACPTSPTADQRENETNCRDLDSCLNPPPAKVEQVLSSGEPFYDELNGVHEPTAESNYESFLPSGLASCENTYSGANRVLSRPTSLHFSNDNSRSSSPVASLPEMTGHDVYPGVAHAQSLTSALRGCPIDYVLERFSPIPPWSSLDSGRNSENSQRLYPGTVSHADLLDVPGLDRSDATEDDFDACEWEARGTARTHGGTECAQAFSAGSPPLRCEAELGVLESCYEYERNAPGTIDHIFVPDCLQDMPHDTSAQSDVSLHLDFDSEDEEPHRRADRGV